ncbi:MAG: hypothetical protein PGN11_01280 [Quadrisphaera sp.]
MATWFTGYTPQLATSVWIGVPEKSMSINGATIGGRRYGSMYGATVSAPIWRAYMNRALDGADQQDFVDPPQSVIGRPPAPPKPTYTPGQGGGGGGQTATQAPGGGQGGGDNGGGQGGGDQGGNNQGGDNGGGQGGGGDQGGGNGGQGGGGQGGGGQGGGGQGGGGQGTTVRAGPRRAGRWPAGRGAAEATRADALLHPPRRDRRGSASHGGAGPVVVVALSGRSSRLAAAPEALEGVPRARTPGPCGAGGRRRAVLGAPAAHPLADGRHGPRAAGGLRVPGASLGAPAGRPWTPSPGAWRSSSATPTRARRSSSVR